MRVSLGRRILDVFDDRMDPRLIAGLGSIALSVRSRSRCTVRYEQGNWVHRYPAGIVVSTTLSGLTAQMEDQVAQDTFLYGYRPRPGDTVVDIGAGVGTEVRLFSRLVGDTGRVVSIEAHPRTFRCLHRTVELNALTNVTLLECAVVGEAGPVYLEDDAVDHLRNGLTSEAAGGVEVTGRRLDEVMAAAGIDRIDLLKMNIEGAELGVLAGSGDALDAVDNLVVSCHDFKAAGPTDAWMCTFAGVTDLLTEAGYRITTRPDDPRPWIPYYVYASRRG
ncbi:FkbM family methyltransferase [Micromonospora sp. NBC_01813]|uniref:FkbM family methyltransferase n=1 Tax=Micromonospora sp. NBC_01813 TaxID=2975988 RepID=UPI002DDA4881|nr:FkbM family methyltransferase [Micromonospora sp. NBC_01813]WSA09252.1 FkbM family methyltransferase [Micromonospora sp. NBC_01813]